MTEAARRLARRRVATDLLTVALGAAALAAYALLGQRVALYVGVYGVLLGTSTAVVTFCLTRFTGIDVRDVGQRAGESGTGGFRTDGPGAGDSSADGTSDEGPDDGGTPLVGAAWGIFSGRALETDADVAEDTGWLIGRLENVIVLTLVLVGEFTALSIIFAAKSWVRMEDTASGNTTYYLAGTLVNFTYSIVAGLLVTWLLAAT